jgi:hypothetical protein
MLVRTLARRPSMENRRSVPRGDLGERLSHAATHRRLGFEIGFEQARRREYLLCVCRHEYRAGAGLERRAHRASVRDRDRHRRVYQLSFQHRRRDRRRRFLTIPLTPGHVTRDDVSSRIHQVTRQRASDLDHRLVGHHDDALPRTDPAVYVDQLAHALLEQAFIHSVLLRP